MSDFQEEAHPRDESGKFIESGGEKLKTWGKAGARKLSGYTSTLRKDDPRNDPASEFWSDGTRGRYGSPWSPDEFRQVHRGYLATLKKYQGRISFKKEQIAGLKQSIKELEAKKTRTPDEEEDLKSHRAYLPVHEDDLKKYQKDLDELKLARGAKDPFFRGKIPSPKGGKAEPGVVRPRASSPKVDIFSRMGGNEEQIAAFQKSPELKQAFENIKHQNDLKKDIELKKIAVSAAESEGERLDDLSNDIEIDKNSYPKGKDIGAEMTPEAQARYDETVRQRTAAYNRADKLRNERDDLYRELKRSQEANSEQFKEILGPWHEEATQAWVGNVMSGMAGDMQRLANRQLAVKWKAGTRDEEATMRQQGVYGEESEAGRQQQRELKEYMQKQYNLSQASMRQDGYKRGDRITLYRGMDIPEKTMDWRYKQRQAHSSQENYEPKFHLEQRPLTSWTDKPTIAAGFGGHVVKAEIPVENIYSNYRLFKNTYDENEYVVLGATDFPVRYVMRS